MITVKFPNCEDVTLEQGKPIVILGANGSGKTRLTVKIDELNDKRFSDNSILDNIPDNDILIHRLSAQKSLTISDTITTPDYDSSKQALYCGEPGGYARKIANRYHSNPATHLLDDFDKALALLFAEDYRELQEDQSANKEAMKNREERPPIITTVREKTMNIWNELLPQRSIELKSGNIRAKNNDIEYHGKEMSDGERVVLYMICQILILPKNSVIIIDEPEMHIHKAVVKKLWDRLEKERTDCVFMYITHDLDFAASRNTDEILWVKSFDGSTIWDYEFLDSSNYEDLPNELLYELIGTRKKVLFVEGDRNSDDHALYSEFFKDKDYHIIPCGGCSEVLRIYKSKKAYEKFNNIEAYCLIDRDFRTSNEITALEEDGVRFLKVAEVENLFVVPALIDIMGKQFGCDPEIVTQSEDFITELFNRVKPSQIGEAFIKEVNHQLTLLNIRDKTERPESIKNTIISAFSSEKLQEYFDEKQQLFDMVTDVDGVLKVFNFKELHKKVGQKLGITNYSKRVITLLKTNSNGVRDQILEALEPYIPELP